MGCSRQHVSEGKRQCELSGVVSKPKLWAALQEQAVERVFTLMGVYAFKHCLHQS